MQRADQRSQAMLLYRQELDQQIRGRDAFKGYGNMTAAEKELNKDDLVAWKKHDNNQYSLIPGVTSQKRFAEQRPVKYGSPVVTGGKAATINEDKLRK